MKRQGRGLALHASLVILLAACAETELRFATDFTPDDLRVVASLSGLGTAPGDATNSWSRNPRAAAFGKKLFFDPRLSATGKVSCATCHDPDKSWADGRPLAEGVGTGRRNSPSLWNLAFSHWYFWDGRSDSLWSQALSPIETRHEMNSSRTSVARLLAGDAELRGAYEAVFGAMPVFQAELPKHATPDGDDERRRAWSAMSPADRENVDRVYVHVGKAIAAFERQIVSRDSPFDRFARGIRERDQSLVDELSAEAQRGLRLFVGRANCILCHHGANFSDGEFHNIGLAVDPKDVDVGRYAGVPLVRKSAFRGTGLHSDDTSETANRHLVFVDQKLSNMGEFKTPTLRNVARTAPYMHDGRMKTLRDVLRFYSDLPDEVRLGHREESLLPLKLTENEIGDLAAFLRSLTDESATKALR